MPLSDLEQIVIVATGLLVTLLLGGLLLYWIDREWRRLDRSAEDEKKREMRDKPNGRTDTPPDA